jgi:hypothetical protein
MISIMDMMGPRTALTECPEKRNDLLFKAKPTKAKSKASSNEPTEMGYDLRTLPPRQLARVAHRRTHRRSRVGTIPGDSPQYSMSRIKAELSSSTCAAPRGDVPTWAARRPVTYAAHGFPASRGSGVSGGDTRGSHIRANVSGGIASRLSSKLFIDGEI